MTNWNEKYRCESLDQIKGQEQNVAKLKAIVRNIHDRVNDGDCPHLYFQGPAGTGKTNTIVAMLKDAFGNAWHYNYSEFNASETRINDIRDLVIELAKKSPLYDYHGSDGNLYPIPFSTIFFDEIDYLPPKSQAILRRIIEKYAKNTRFVLSCNFGHKVIPALKSRCMNFTFGRLRSTSIKQILEPIIEDENIKITEDALEMIADLCNGDARVAQNILQKASLTGQVTIQEVQICSVEVLERFNIQLISQAVRANKSTDDKYNVQWKRLDKHLDTMYYDKGYTGSQILINIFDSIVSDKEMPVSLKRSLFSSIGRCMADCSLVDNDLYVLKMWLRSIK